MMTDIIRSYGILMDQQYSQSLIQVCLLLINSVVIYYYSLIFNIFSFYLYNFGFNFNLSLSFSNFVICFCHFLFLIFHYSFNVFLFKF